MFEDLITNQQIREARMEYIRGFEPYSYILCVRGMYFVYVAGVIISYDRNIDTAVRNAFTDIRSKTITL